MLIVIWLDWISYFFINVLYIIIIICTLYNYKPLRNNSAINQRIIISYSEYEKARLNNKIQPGKISQIVHSKRGFI